MTGSSVLDAVLFFCSFLLAFLIALAEAAVAAASRSRLEELVEHGVQSAVHALRLKDSDEDRRATLKISTLFLFILCAMLVSPHVVHWAETFATTTQRPWLQFLLQPVGVMLAAAMLCGLFLLTVTLIGRAIGVRYADAFVLSLSGGLHVTSKLIRPVQRFMTGLAGIVLTPFKVGATFYNGVTTEENLMDMLEDGAKAGLLDRMEHEMIESIIHFTQTTAREIMIPRTDIVAVELGMSAERILELFLEEGFTRMPVYSESLDNILGVVYAKDVISLIQHKHLIILQDILRPAYIVPETKSISDLLREFQMKRQHMAIVVDEFGGTEGLITMEDILEEIVGEIRDEYDEEESPYTLLPEGGIEVEAMVNISDFNTFSEITIPESEEYDTVGGFVTTLFGRIPEEGENITFEQLAIDVLQAEERRVKKVRLRRLVTNNTMRNS